MLKIIFEKQMQVETLVFKYLEDFRLTQKFFRDALTSCLRDPDCSQFDFLTGQTHKFESKADDILLELNELMYGKALLPESRGDIMRLMDAIDCIPRLFETILYSIQAQKLQIIEMMIMDFVDLLDGSLECCDLMVAQVEALFRNAGGIRDLMSRIDHKENECDHMERRIIRKIFESGAEPFVKLQLKEIIVLMGEISDQAERIARSVNIISMKRRV